MQNYRIVKLNNEALKLLGKDNWILCTIYNDCMYFRKETKQTKIKPIETETYTKFKQIYPKKDGIYSEQVKSKIQKIELDGISKDFLDGVDRYIKKCQIDNKTDNFILNPLTFLNQMRWKDNFTISLTKVPFNEKWILPLLDKLEVKDIDRVLEVKNEWKKTNPTKELTEGIILNIINKILGKDI